MIRTLKITALALFGAVLLWACGSTATDPKDIGKEFLEAINNNDYGTAQKYGTEKTNEALKGLEEMMANMPGDPPANDAKIEIGEWEENGDSGVLHYTENGTPKTLKMVKVEDNWKVEWSKIPDMGGMSDPEPTPAPAPEMDMDGDMDADGDMEDGMEDMEEAHEDAHEH